MQHLEYTLVDKSEWPRGRWDGEPDKVQWQDEATGLPCLAVRNSMGAWCGYVGVAEGHPFFRDEHQLHYDLSVHGGVTFSDFCVETEKEYGICHIPDEGEPDRVWWFGFDCGHSMDQIPLFDLRYQSLGFDRVYRTLDYVKAECTGLAEQLHAAARREESAEALTSVI